MVQQKPNRELPSLPQNGCVELLRVVALLRLRRKKLTLIPNDLACFSEDGVQWLLHQFGMIVMEVTLNLSEPALVLEMAVLLVAVALLILRAPRILLLLLTPTWIQIRLSYSLCIPAMSFGMPRHRLTVVVSSQLYAKCTRRLALNPSHGGTGLRQERLTT